MDNCEASREVGDDSERSNWSCGIDEKGDGGEYGSGGGESWMVRRVMEERLGVKGERKGG